MNTVITSPGTIDVSRFTPEQRLELSMRMMCMDWERGGACSPDTADYARAAVTILGDTDLEFAEFATQVALQAIERHNSPLLERIYNRDCEGVELSELADFIIAEVREASKARP